MASHQKRGRDSGTGGTGLVIHQGVGMKIRRFTTAHKSKTRSDALVSFGNMAPARSFFLPTNQRPTSASSAAGAKINAEPWRDQTTPVAHLGMPDCDGPYRS